MPTVICSEPVLYVAWRDPRTRLILPVARLLRCSGGDFEFAYVKGSEEAAEQGFEPFLAFPKREVVYRSETLPPFFQNRVMSSSRPDYPEHVSSLGLDPVCRALHALGIERRPPRN